jgi:hypothetical protein
VSENEFQKFILRPQSMVSEVRPVRGGRSPRSLAVKLTGVAAHNDVDNLPLAVGEVGRKEAGRKEEEAVQMGRDDGEGVQEPEERKPADTWRQARN